MRPLDVGHCPRMQVQPFLTEDGVPSPADELVDHDQEPNCEMINFRVHKPSADYRGVSSSIASRFRR
jgi:hypothetical protein